MIKRAIHDVIQRYKELREEYRLLKRIVSHPLDYDFLEKLCKLQDKEIDIELNDHTIIRIRCKEQPTRKFSTFKDEFESRYK